MYYFHHSVILLYYGPRTYFLDKYLIVEYFLNKLYLKVFKQNAPQYAVIRAIIPKTYSESHIAFPLKTRNDGQAIITFN